MSVQLSRFPLTPFATQSVKDVRPPRDPIKVGPETPRVSQGKQAQTQPIVSKSDMDVAAPTKIRRTGGTDLPQTLPPSQSATGSPAHSGRSGGTLNLLA